MTKLTTERLEKLQDDLLQFQDSYSDPADKENYDIFVDALHVLNELKAFRNAANNPVAWLRKEDRNHASDTTHDFDVANEWRARGLHVIDLYAEPVLPKQPEHSRQHFESLCNQFWNWAELDEIDQDEEPRLEWNGSNYTHRVTAALWKMYQAAPAQPVIPEQPDAQDLELYIDMLENSDSDDQDGELNNTQLIMWLKELQRRRTLPAQPANGDKQ